MPIPYAPKLRLAPLLPMLVALLLAATLAAVLLPRAIADQAAHELQQTLRLVEPSLPLALGARAAPSAELEQAVNTLVARTDFRLTLIAEDGVVLADSERSLDQLAEMENHRERKEVVDALAHGEGFAVRNISTTGTKTAYAARLVRAADGSAVVARLALPIRSLSSYRFHLIGLLALAALAAAAAAMVVSLWLSRTLFQPLSRLIAVAGKIGDGDYRAPVELPEETELAALAHALQRIAREAEHQLAAVEAERDHLRATVESMAEGVLVVDPRGRAQLANSAFRALFALPGDAAADELLDLAREPRLSDLIRGVLDADGPRSAELERHDPVPRTLALLANRLSRDGGAVIVARDITETERLHRMRRDFVANVSHELKTPLAAIRGYAETLVDGALDERATALRFSARILEQSRRLGELIDDLLTLSRLESTEPIRAAERVDLGELAAEAVELVAARAAAKPVALELDPGSSPAVDGDWEGLLRLLTNLLDNAIKYNHPGGSVSVRLSEVDGQARMEVTDRGIGIPPLHLARIFERFYRVDSGRARDEGGTGLGLAIVKHVAQAHGGRVEVESTLGAGTTFRVLLPLAGSH